MTNINAATPEALYRHFSADGVLLYVGVSSRLPKRIDEHSKLSHWWAEIARIEIEWFDDREAVLRAERAAILSERPRYNKRGARFAIIGAAINEPSSALRLGRENLTARIVQLRPFYKISELRQMLGISRNHIHKEIADGRLGYVDLPAPNSDKIVRYVSAWQIIDWLEVINAKTVSRPE